MSKKVLLLGSTGSIGKSTLSVIREYPQCFQVMGIVATGVNTKALIDQALEFKVGWVGISQVEFYPRLKDTLAGKVEIIVGLENILSKIVSESYDITIGAIVGIAGLKPTMAAISSSKYLALANKESLVCAGSLIKTEASKNNCKILPLDSEHNAMFQVFERDNCKVIDKIILTASGGPFLNRNREQLANVTREQALKHPNWSMGAKISVDSATLVNKGLEFIETVQLFPITSEQIEVVVHPQSIVHSCIAYQDGSVLAQMGAPDMRTPIAYSLFYPVRKAISHKSLSLPQLGSLTFQEPDNETFPAITLAKSALREGQCALIAFNAANEYAVAEFLSGRIKFLDIYKIIEEVLSQISNIKLGNTDHVIEYHKEILSLAEGVRL